MQSHTIQAAKQLFDLGHLFRGFKLFQAISLTYKFKFVSSFGDPVIIRFLIHFEPQMYILETALISYSRFQITWGLHIAILMEKMTI